MIVTTPSVFGVHDMKFFSAGLVLAAAFALAAPAIGGEFPVTVSHGFGETTIPAQPKRVVSIGYIEQDFLYALGIAPVGVRNWWGDYEYATWPWADAARESVHAEPLVMPGDELNLEWILEQDPDLIVGVFVGLEQDDYDALSKIAPVVAVPEGFAAWSVPWQEELRIIDKATAGDTVKSDAIIANIEARFAQVQSDYPQFAGKTGTVTYYADGNFVSFDAEDSASRFFVSLGLTFPPALAGKGGEGNQINISTENVSMLDMDVAIWPISTGDTETQKTVEAMPLYQNQRLATDGRSLWLDDGAGILTAALTYQSPLAIEFLLDRLPPLVAAAVDGDPATAVVVPPAE